MAITPTDPITGFPTGFPLTEIQPFTYRDGMTYAMKLEALASYVTLTLVPEIERIIKESNDHVDEEIAALIIAVNAAILANKEYTDEQIAEMRQYVDDAVASIIGDSITVQDPVVAALVNNALSATRVALDALYQPKGTVADDAVAALFGSATATRNAVDARYKEDAQVEDVAHGGTGRANSGVPYGLIAAGNTIVNPQQTVPLGASGFFLKSNGANAYPAFVKLLDDAAAAADTVYSSNKTTALVKDKTLRGTRAARPAATAVPEMTIYIATDVPEQYIAVAGAWQVFGSGGNEIGYSQIVSTISTNSPTPVAIAGFTTTFVVGDRPIMMEIFAKIRNNTADTITSVRLMLDGTQVCEIAHDGMYASAYVTMMSAARKAGLTPGSSHTLTVQWVVGGGTAEIEGSATNPAYVRIFNV